MYLLKCNENINNYVNPANDSLILDTIFFIQLYNIIIGYLRHNFRHAKKITKKSLKREALVINAFRLL